jgi:type II restriction/modification system DNA methylase subunit YeeA
MKEEEKKWVCMIGDKHVFRFKTRRGLIQHLNRNPYHKGDC